MVRGEDNRIIAPRRHRIVRHLHNQLHLYQSVLQYNLPYFLPYLYCHVSTLSFHNYFNATDFLQYYDVEFSLF